MAVIAPVRRGGTVQRAGCGLTDIAWPPQPVLFHVFIATPVGSHHKYGPT